MSLGKCIVGIAIWFTCCLRPWYTVFSGSNFTSERSNSHDFVIGSCKNPNHQSTSSCTESMIQERKELIGFLITHRLTHLV